MIKEKIATWFAIILVLSLLTLMPIVNIVNAQQTEVKVINPETGDSNFIFYTNETSEGTRFNATVWVYDVTDLFAFQVNLTVNDERLNITNAWIPKWNSTYVFYGLSTMPLGPTFYDQDADNKSESVLIGDTIMGPGSSFTGTGLLAIIELEIIYTPNATKYEGMVACELNIEKETILMDSGLKDISANIFNGYYIFSHPPPKADFTFSPVQPYINSTVTFNASSSQPSIFPITNYIWGFGDGNKTQTSNPIITHVYTKNKTFTVTLTVIDKGGLNETVQKSITVIAPGGSAVTIKTAPKKVSINETVHVWGEIIADEPKSSVNVTIQYKEEYYNRTKGKWEVLAIVKTNETSQYKYFWTPTNAGLYILRAYWEGDENTTGAISTYANVSVIQESEVKIYIGPETVGAFAPVEINGTIAPAPPNPANVAIKYRLFNSAQDWTILANVTAINGHYNYTWITTKEFIGTRNENDTFEFMAEWSGDEITLRAQSNIEKLTVLKIKLEISISVAPNQTLTGSNVTITGSVSPPIGDLEIGIRAFTDPNATSWESARYVGTAITAKNGSFATTWSIPLGATGEFWLKARYAGDYNIFETNLTEITPAFLNITKFKSNITLIIDKSEVQIGELVKFAGKINPPKEGVRVHIYYNREGGSFSELNILVYTNESGAYNLTWKAGETLAGWKAGNYSIYASWIGDQLYYGGKSHLVHLLVSKNSSNLYINVQPEKIKQGENVTINGTLNPALPNMTITIHLKLNETGETLAFNVLTNANGTFTYVWTANQTGTYEIYAVWEGNDVYQRSVSNKEVITVEQPFTIMTYLPYIGVAVGAIVVIVALAIYLRRKSRKT